MLTIYFSVVNKITGKTLESLEIWEKCGAAACWVAGHTNRGVLAGLPVTSFAGIQEGNERVAKWVCGAENCRKSVNGA